VSAETATAARPDVYEVALDGELTVYQAAALKETILSSLTRGGAIRVDLSGVTAIDGAGIQLLLLWQSLAGARGLDLGLVVCSQVVVEMLELLRLSARFPIAGRVPV